ncbi:MULTISPECIES: response regulator transcription factor [Pantoea]|jgi:FixJ family two-component response regulator|uniref:response regulator transcription factor n=1 Tax=Pantoea TaxID=53335 RepID=UPI000EA0E797|nr:MULTISPECIES: response regulator [Pantoea]MDU6431410.1 response regulator [Pantoea sp.]MBZ6406355.1 response regulator [Pantoea piersonii]MBZ6425101.1 response regulator [Pantoea piersonii]NYB02730.1 response regulator transcription factor [Pantoea piersonii]NYB07473.1 response regulator transcription factor [Pantoea piersonii]
MDKTIYIVDDEESVIASLQNLLSSEGYQVSTFLSPSAFLDQADYSTPCCLIVDLNMPGLDGFDVSLHLTERGYSIPTIFLTGYGTIPLTVRAMKAGAFEFLTKPVMPDALLRVVSEALALSEKCALASQEKRAMTARFSSLTPREKELMQYVIRGLLNKQVAAEMGISEITAKVHKRRVMEKMAVRSVSDLVRAAEKLGLPEQS